MTRSPIPPRVGALLLALAVPAVASAAGSGLHVLAWPPTRYQRAEVVAWRDGADAGRVRARITARGLDVTLDVASGVATRVPLPAEAQCALGLDACAIRVERVEGSDGLHVLLQSPDTAGQADTLLLTAHDTVRVPPASQAAFEALVVSWPCPPGTAFPQSASFASIVPVGAGARVSLSGPNCSNDTIESVEAGWVLTVACTGPAADVTGLRVEADAPVLVLAGNVVATVPEDASLSGDLLLDLASEPHAAGTTLVACPLPRRVSHEGLGDLVRVVPMSDGTLRVVDDVGERLVPLRAFEPLDLDTAGAGRDLTLRLEADVPVAAWHLAKSRALRGIGDAAALPLASADAFAARASTFVPDGYAEGTFVLVVAEETGEVRVDGVAITDWARVPGGPGSSGVGLRRATVALPPPPSGPGSVVRVEGEARFSAVLVGFGGFKGHGCAVTTRAAGWRVLRGVEADALAEVARAAGRSHVDATAGGLVFWSIEGEPGPLLRARRCGPDTCLEW